MNEHWFLDVLEFHKKFCPDMIGDLPARPVQGTVDLRPAWDAVHAANMTKIGGGRTEAGKIRKPANFVPPDIASVLARQLPLLNPKPGGPE